MIFFTSDIHAGHNRGFIYEPRGFTSIEEHDNAIIERWNSVVSKDDEVYILGDLMLNDNQYGIKLLNRLNGKKHMVRGNHDTDARMPLYIENNIIYESWAYMLHYQKYHFYLSHFPTMTGSLEHDNLSKTTLNLFGHTHSKDKFYQDRPYMYNVALDAHDCYPVSIDQIIADMEEKIEECRRML